MEDLVRILLAFVIGYVVFITTFYYLAKLMFPKVELDEEYEKLLMTYKKSKPRVASVNRKFNPDAFKISDSLRHRINYNKI